jgi:O-antigen ligase
MMRAMSDPPRTPPSLLTPDWAVTVLACTLFALPALGVPGEWPLQDTLKSSVMALGTVLAGLGFFGQRLCNVQHPPAALRWHGLVWLPLAFAAYALGTMALKNPYLAGAEALRWSIVALALWLGLQVVQHRSLPTLLWGLHAGLCVAATWAVLQFWWGWSLFPQAQSPGSTFANRNFFAEYAVCALPYAVLLWAQCQQRRLRLVLAVSLAWVCLSILMTGTRSALLALMLDGCAAAILLLRYKALAFAQWGRAQRLASCGAFVGTLLVLGLVAGADTGPDTGPGAGPVAGSGAGAGSAAGSAAESSNAWQRSLGRGATLLHVPSDTQQTPGNSVALRLDIWKASLRLIKDHPLGGVGAGHWEVAIALYQPPQTMANTDYFAHNEVLQWLGEYGLPVGGLVLAFLLAYLAKAGAVAWRHPAALNGAYGWVALSSLLSLMLVSLFGFPLHLAGCSLLAALGLAVLARSSDSLSHHEADALPPTPQARNLARNLASNAKALNTTGLVLMALSVVLALVVVVQAVRAERFLMQAIHLTNGMVRDMRDSPTPTSSVRHEQALKLTQAGLAIHPHYIRLIAVIASNLAAVGDLRGAVGLWEVICQSHPHYPLVWTDMVLAYTRLGDTEAALRALEPLQRLTAQQADMQAQTQILKAIVLVKAKRYAQATQVVEQLLDADRWDPALLETGYVLGLDSQNWALAVRCLQLRLVHEPGAAQETQLRLRKVHEAAR